MKKMFSTSVGLLASILILGSFGCSGGPTGPSGTVAGKVTLNGEAIPAGHTVAFISDSGSAAATIGAGGSYTLMSGESAQVPIGKYKVTIGLPSAGELSTAEYDKQMEAGGAATKAKAPESSIPTKYLVPGTSDLEFEVKEGGNTFDIDLN